MSGISNPPPVSLTLRRTVNGTSDTIVYGDLKQFVVYTSGSATTVTFPATLPVDFETTLRQVGAGQLTFVAGSGATVDNVLTQLKSAGQHAIIYAVVDTNADGNSASWTISGATSP